MTAQSRLPDPGDIPVPTAGFVLEELDGELLLFNPDDGRLLELNSTAALIWQLCDGVRTISAITELLHKVFPDAGPDIHDDVAQILARLAQLGAISWQ